MESNKDDFLVIGAGLPRTGTLSLMHALELILPGNCHHMKKAATYNDEWTDIFTGQMDDEGFKEFFRKNNEVAAVDVPFCFQYKRAMRLFPNANVILTIRDPESWVTSMKATVFKRRWYDPTIIFMLLNIFPNYLQDPRGENKKWPLTLLRELEKTGGLYKAITENNGIDYYTRWTREVEEYVPRDKLLKFHVKEGWEPLCKFLSVPVPNVPFPKVNSTQEFDSARALSYRRAWLLVYEFISIPLWVYSIYKMSQ